MHLCMDCSKYPRYWEGSFQCIACFDEMIARFKTRQVENDKQYPMYIKMLIAAYEKGYRVSRKGEIIGLRNKPLKLSDKIYYSDFSIYYKGKYYRIPTHVFAAYYYFGSKALNKKVRYKNGDIFDLRKENIALEESK